MLLAENMLVYGTSDPAAHHAHTAFLLFHTISRQAPLAISRQMMTIAPLIVRGSVVLRALAIRSACEAAGRGAVTCG